MVETRDGPARSGRFVRVETAERQDLWVVEDDEHRERLIPAVPRSWWR